MLAMLDRLQSFLDQHSRILLTTHENPDGDGIGACLALAHYLRFLRKEPRIIVSPAVPGNLCWLDTEGWIEPFEAAGVHADLAAWPDAWLLVDASEPHRLGAMYPLFETTKAPRACLDHHLKDAPKGFEAEFTDPTATASGELVYDLAARRMGLPLPAAMAEAVYASLISDTGNFRFSNSTGKVHRLAAGLIEQGVQPARSYQRIYLQDTPSKVKVWGRALERMSLLFDGTFGLMVLTLEDMKDCGATHDDLDELVQQPTRLATVEVAGLLYELADGRVKLSLRSKEAVDVNAVCKLFGGGGHRLASGAKLEGPLKEAQAKVAAAVSAQLERDLPKP
ncbi:MAG: bifunctional oligoribonuclease/PAP phosphatase NrnA [Acidobacteriota bacterium]|nr:bifunctional oligoribonuclease/PAP phosphatase NrnA [Acidobacteriota bacterium]